MPIVTVESVVTEGESPYPADLVQQLTDALAGLFGSEPSSTWVKMRYLDRAHYAENHTTLSDDTRPTFVEILKASLSNEDALATEAAAVADSVARILARPRDNVHVLYLPQGRGRMAFGGNLLRSDE